MTFRDSFYISRGLQENAEDLFSPTQQQCLQEVKEKNLSKNWNADSVE